MQGDFKLTLNNFNKLISSGMLKKGQDYFDNGAVIEIDEHDGKWTAEVEGTDEYTVTVEVKKKSEIKEWFCDCPYDGDLCKHVVAVLFSIKEQIALQKTIPLNNNPKKLFDSVLSKVNLEELREFIKHYASANKEFKNAFELYFAEKDDRIDIGEKYRDLIHKLIKKHSDRGHLDYRGGIALAKEIMQLIQQGIQLTHKNNYQDALTIGAVVLKEMMEVVTYCDDSNGSVAETISYSIELIEDIATDEHVAMDIKVQVYNFLSKELKDKRYLQNGDFGYDLLSLFKELSISLNHTDDYLQYLTLMPGKLTDKYDSYTRDFFQRERIDFLNEIGRTSEAEVLIAENMDIRGVRQTEIDKALAAKDFVKAKKLINEGMKKAQEDKLSGLASSWEKQLLDIAVMENDIALVRAYCKKFAFDRFLNSEYYNQWKATFTKEEWPAIIKEVIKERETAARKAKKNNGWWSLDQELREALAPIYIIEKYFGRLFELLKEEKQLSTLIHYHQYLFKDYANEMLQLYLPALVTEGDAASDRSRYAELVKTMKMIVKDIPAGRDAIKQTAQSLLVKYPRRPAMAEELKKFLELLK